MEGISFCTAVTYVEPKGCGLAQAAEDYFHLCGKKAVVIPWKDGFLSREVELHRVQTRVALIVIKLLSYLTVVIPLCMLIVKLIFRESHSFYTLPRADWLTQETVGKVQSVMERVLNREGGDDIHLYQCQHHHRVFSLSGVPHLIFKMVPEDSQEVEARYKKSSLARQIWLKNKFDLLVVPRVELFTVDYQGRRYTILAEEKLEVKEGQSRLYREQPTRLRAALKQLARFICQSQFSDVEERNLLILRGDQLGNYRLGLPDFEEMKSADIGLFGDRGFYKRTGLLGLSPRGERRALLAEAKRELSWTAERRAEEKRVLREEEAELAEIRALQVFYRERGVVEASQPIDSKLAKRFQGRRERAVARAFIEEVNRQLRESSKELPLSERRRLLINTNQSPLTVSAVKPVIEALTHPHGPIYRVIRKGPAGILLQL